MDESSMTPEQILFRLRRECEDRMGTTTVAKATGYSQSYISRLVKGDRRITPAVAKRLALYWAKMDGRIHAVVPLPSGASPVEAVPDQLERPTGALVEAMTFRAGRWSRETIQVLCELQAVLRKHGLHCPVGQWPDLGDRAEQELSTSSKRQG